MDELRTWLLQHKMEVELDSRWIRPDSFEFRVVYRDGRHNDLRLQTYKRGDIDQDEMARIMFRMIKCYCIVD